MLTVLVGVALMTLFTANVVAFFVGGEETRMRENLQRDIAALRLEIEQLRKDLAVLRKGEPRAPPPDVSDEG